MKRYLFITFLLVMIFSACNKLDRELANNRIDIPGDGKVTFSINLHIKDASIYAVESRSVSSGAWVEKENVTEINGWAFVFSKDPLDPTGYGDNSILLQKQAFKSSVIGGKSIIYVTLDEHDEPCYIRLLTSMTQGVVDEIGGFISLKEINEGATGAVTTFADYRHIGVNLSGYYADANSPDPNIFTDNLAFPLASSGINMEKGLTEESIADANLSLPLIPPASKVDVTSKCNFFLKEVTLLNGAKMARLRSTLLAADGTTVIETLPLPTNLGGTVTYKPVMADHSGKTTANTPIYFFPNRGDGPFDNPLEPDEEYPNNNSSLSDNINGNNPTYLIVKGRANGYNVDGYYKIPILYKFEIVGDDGKPSGRYSEPTFNIVRNNHFKINLNSVNNPGYASMQEAIDGPANNISYDISIGGGVDAGESSDFNHPSTETIISSNGLYHIELVGSEIFAQGYGLQGFTGEFALKLQRNSIVDVAYNIPTLYISSLNGTTTINNNSIIEDDNFSGIITFKATASDIITIRCGNILKEIPIHYNATPHVWQSGRTIGGAELGDILQLKGDNISSANDLDMVGLDGFIGENNTFKNREFRGKAYPKEFSKGIYKLYCKQASNFYLKTYYNNTANSITGGNEGVNNIFEESGSNIFLAAIDYQSTGKVSKINNIYRGVLDDHSTMIKWWIGNAQIEFTPLGEFTSKFNGEFTNFTTTGDWNNLSNGSTVTLKARDIKSNQRGTYLPKNSHIYNSATLLLTNIAGQEKSYNINLDQYAAPYVEGTVLEDGKYVWLCPRDADYSYTGVANNKGELLGSVQVYNANYKEGEYPVGDYIWEESAGSGGYSGGADALRYVKEAVNIQATEVSPNLWKFDVRTNEKYSSTTRYGKYEAFFNLKITNKANEEIYLRCIIRRYD